MLLPIFVTSEAGCVDSTDCIDNFDRANSATLGTATNGNVWIELLDDATDSFEILTNRMKGFVEQTGDASATLTLASTQNITTTGEYIGFRLRSDSDKLSAGILINFTQSGETVWTMFTGATQDGGASAERFRNGSSTSGELLTTSSSTSALSLSWIFKFNFENQSVDIEVNGTDAGSMNVIFEKAGVTYIDGIELGPRAGQSGLSWGTEYDYINISIAAVDPCSYVSGVYAPTFSDGCTLTSFVDVSSDVCRITGDAGTFQIGSAGVLQCKEIHIEPDDFDGDSIFSILTGGVLSKLTS